MLAQAARMLGGSVEFAVAGLPQPRDPDGLSDAEVSALAAAPGIRFLGAVPTADMPRQLALAMLLFCRLRIAKVFRAS